MIRGPLACAADKIRLLVVLSMSAYVVYRTVISQQVTRLRAAVLLATLVVVPLVAALGTSPSQWFAAKPSTAEAPHEEKPGQTTTTDNRTPPKSDLARPHNHAPKNSAAAANHAHAGTNTPKVASKSTPKPAADDSVLRRWAHDDSPTGPPAADRPAPAPHASASTPPSQFRSIEQQLRAWGATYYLLEHWSNQGPLYRFHCRMSIDGLKHYNQHFEAVADDPEAAMQDVLQQVRAWRAPRVVRPTT
jgi:hypothetical protein